MYICYPIIVHCPCCAVPTEAAFDGLQSFGWHSPVQAASSV